MTQLKQHMVWNVNRATMGWNSMRMTLTLAVQEIPLRAVHTTHRLRRGVTPRRLVFACIMAALVATPTALYLREHTQHIASKRALRMLALTSASEGEFLRSSVRDLLYQQTRLTGFLLDSGFSIRTGNNVTVKVVATGYSSTVWETDATPFVTAANTRTREGVLAMSRDLLARYTPGAPFNFGDRVYMSGLGYFIVEDSMNQRWDNRVDVWFPSREQARNFGRHDVYLSRAESAQSSSGGSGSAASGL